MTSEFKTFRLSPSSLESSNVQINSSLLNLIVSDEDRKNPNIKNIVKAAGIMLDDTGRFFQAFDVGLQKVRIYGNPVVMASNCGFFADVLDDIIGASSDNVTRASPSDVLHIAATSDLSKNLSSFISVWLHINGFPSEYYFTNFESGATIDIEHVYKIIMQQLAMWDWMKYFSTDTYAHAFNQYVMDLYLTLLDLISSTNPGLDEGEVKELKFPVEFKESIKDLHEQLKSLVVNNEILRDTETPSNVDRLFGFIVGDFTYAEYLDLVKTIPNEYNDLYVFGYPTAIKIQEEKEQKEREEKELERGKEMNRKAWESMGPPPYPNDYELFWPGFYPGADWKTNVEYWNNVGPITPIASSESTPKGSYAPGTPTTSVFLAEPDYPLDALEKERKRLGIRRNVSYEGAGSLSSLRWGTPSFPVAGYGQANSTMIPDLIDGSDEGGDTVNNYADATNEDIMQSVAAEILGNARDNINFQAPPVVQSNVELTSATIPSIPMFNPFTERWDEL